MNIVNADKLKEFLHKVDSLFPSPISEKKDLDSYAEKLVEKGTVCVQEIDSKIVSIVAGYTDNVMDECAYIALVASLKEVQRKGYTSKNLNEFIKICRDKHLKFIHLYTVESNKPAVNFYLSHGFCKYELVNEPRPNDLHLILYL